VLGTLCVAGFGACYWINAKPWLLGATLGGGLTFLGIGLVAWGKYLMPAGPFVEERHVLANSPGGARRPGRAIVQRGGGVIKRRKMLGGLLGGGLGIFGIVALFPLLRSLGPMPKTTLDTPTGARAPTPWTSPGDGCTVGDLAVGSS
jgi:ubiquinol-cytochrome c reductase iron-sulfur subunit